MRNSAYDSHGGRGSGLADVLQNPIFTNVVRLFLIAIFSLAGYIWKTEMDHVNRALADIKSSMADSVGRQWSEIHGVRREVSQMNQDLYTVLYRTNDLLFELAREPLRVPAGGRTRDEPPRPPSGMRGQP